jgi:autotransporter-associated beta strand protein
VTHRTRAQRRQTSAALSAAVCLSVLTAAAVADTYSWTGATGNFSTATNWAGGVAPTGLSATDTLVFDTANAYTATNNIYTAATRRQFYLTKMTLNDPSPITVDSLGRKGTATTGAGAITVYPPFRFVTGNGLIEQLGTGTANVSAPVNVGPGGTLTIQAAAGSGQLTLANLTAPAALASNVHVQGEGTINFNNLSSNAILVGNMAQYVGDVNVLAGTVSAADSPNTTTAGGPGTGGGDTISNETLITVAAGATFDFNRNGETMGGIAGAGTIALGSTGGIGLNYNKSDLTFSGDITRAAGLPTDTPGNVTKDLGSGHTTYTWTGNAQHAGSTAINAGTLVLSGNGQLSATSAVTVSGGASLILDNTAQSLGGRLNPAATLNVGGNLTILGTANEAAAGLVIGGTTGEGNINVADAASTLTIGTLTYGATPGGFVNFSGPGSVSFTTAPALTNGIIPQAAVNYGDWATVDGTNKVVALSTYQTSADPTTWAATDNVRVSGPLSGNADASVSTVNSLALAGGASANIGNSLTLAGGALLASGAGAAVTGGQINSSAANGQLTVVVAPTANLVLNSNIPDGAVVKAGPGTLSLGGNNAFAGGLVITKGTVQVASDAAMGNGTITLTGGTLAFTAPVSSTKVVSLFGIDSVIDTGANDVSLTGTLGASNAGNLTKKGSGTLTIALFNSSGDMNIDEGKVVVGSGSPFTNGTTVTVAAGATLDLSFDPSGEDFGMLAGAGTVLMFANANIGLNALADGMTFSGSIRSAVNGVEQVGTGGLDKSAAGSILLTGSSTYAGPTRIQVGTIVIGASVLPAVDGPLGNASSAVQVGFTPSSGTSAADLASPAQFFIGTAGVTMGRDISVPAGTSGANGTATGMITIGTRHTSGSSTYTGNISMARAVELYTAGTSTTSLTGVISGNGALSKTGGGTAVLDNTNTFAGGVHVQSGTLVLASVGAGSTGSYNVSGGVLAAQAGLPTPLKPSALFVSDQGRFDLNDNDLVLEYATTSPLAPVRSAVAAARNGGAWDQAGITSTSAKNANGLTTLAVFEASDTGVTDFGGVPVDGTAVLVKYTYYGDVNVDGRLNGDDLALADRSVALGGLPGTARWVDGDVNYDGVVNAADFLLIDRTFALWDGTTLSPDFLAGRAAQFGDGYVSALVASVPEPTSLGLVGIAAGGLFARRRRQR